MSEPSRDARQTLLYNEQKLEQGQARFLGAFNYWQEDAQLTFDDKLHRLQQQMVLNERSQAKIVHLSLNFHPDDQLTDKMMHRIASEFMPKIDFADQPALVYRHLDAGHPHMHVVTINIRPNGSRIKNDLRSPHHLMEICAGLEVRHHLTPVIPRSVRRVYDETWAILFADKEGQPAPRQTQAQPLKYGQSPTKTGIDKVLRYVLDKYIYTSIDELNAVLSLYRVRADRGSEQGRMYQNRGLYYRMIDEDGRKIGAPIKASSFDQRPTLDYLAKRFEEGRLRQRNVRRMRETIDSTLFQRQLDCLESFSYHLRQADVELSAPASGKGFYYIDATSNTVYKDIDLGVDYTAAAVLRRSGLEQTLFLLGISEQLMVTPKERQSLLQQEKMEPDTRLRLYLRLSRQNDRRVNLQFEQEKALRVRKSEEILKEMDLKIEQQAQRQIEAQIRRQAEQQVQKQSEQQISKQSEDLTRKQTIRKVKTQRQRHTPRHQL